MTIGSSEIEISIVTITYNEQNNIKNLISEILNIFNQNSISGEVVVVDDNSPDGTAEIVSSFSKINNRVKLVLRPCRMGIGSAYYDGLSRASGKVLIMMDADFSHPPATILPMFKTAQKGILVIGSRFKKGVHFQSKFHRMFASVLLNKLASFVLKTNLKEHTSGYLAIVKEDFELLMAEADKLNIKPFSQVHYGTPLIALAKHIQLNAIEIPAPYIFRKDEKSKIGIIFGLKTFLSHARFIFLLRKKLKIR